MRGIGVRGKVIEALANGQKWIYSDDEMPEFYLNHVDKFAYINGVAVEYETVTQYTGLKDIYRKEIYESDYVRGFHRNFEVGNVVEVTFLNGCFMFGTYNAHEFFNMHQHIEVIGNIYENSELLEVNHD